MSTTAVGHCSHCAAVVNCRWSRCLVCHAPLIAAPLPSQSPHEAHTVNPGDRIKWQRAGTSQQGLVDFLHCDADGTMWAFCTVPGGNWAAVNVKFAKGSHA